MDARLTETPADSSTGATRPGTRLVAVDLFRGVALTVVLLNHFDWSADRIVFRRWTPVGLGFSDGAEAFVFLSGLTFGWVYSTRLRRDGIRSGMPKVLYRVLQLYFGYVVCLLAVTALSFAPIDMTEWSRNPLRIVAGESLTDALLNSVRLAHFPYGLGILGLYMAILPAMLLLLALAQRARWAALAISFGLWLAVQPPLGSLLSRPACLAGWGFHPLAWQLLFFVGMLIGEHLRRTQVPLPRLKAPAAVAVLVVLYGLAATKHRELVALTGLSDPDLLRWLQLGQSWLTEKSNLGPFRLVHFAAVAYLTAYWLPAGSRMWDRAWAQPLIWTGRHSLLLYCGGTLMIYAAAMPLERLGNSPHVVVTIGLAACMLQFALAGLLELRRSRPVADAQTAHTVPARFNSPSGTA